MRDTITVGDLAGIVSEKIVKTALRGKRQIATCAEFRIRCEGWLKVELLLTFLDFVTKDDVDIFSEREKVDLTITTPSGQLLLELKTFPTNYGSGGKSITTSIDSVIEDLDKLSRLRGNGTGLAAWLAYPIPKPVPSTWPGHVKRVEQSARRTLRAEWIDLLRPDAYANLFVMESR